MRATCRLRRTCGRVGRSRLFLDAIAQAGLLLAQEHERLRNQGNVVMEALPASSLEVVEPEFVQGYAGKERALRPFGTLPPGDPLPRRGEQSLRDGEQVLWARGSAAGRAWPENPATPARGSPKRGGSCQAVVVQGTRTQ